MEHNNPTKTQLEAGRLFRQLSRTQKAEFINERLQYATDDTVGERCNQEYLDLLPYVDNVNIIEYLEKTGLYQVVKL